MPITRTAWVDDDGTGTTGTIINNAEKQALYNQIDASAAFVNQQNSFAADQSITKSGPALVFADTSAPANARNFVVANAGQRFYVQAVSDAYAVQATPLQLYRDGGMSVGTNIYEQGRTTPLGHWIAVPFNAGQFNGYSATWTVAPENVYVNRYTIVGRMVTWTLSLYNTGLSGPTSQLYLGPPINAANSYTSAPGVLSDGAGAFPCMVRTASSSAFPIFRLTGSAFTGPTFLHVDFTITYEMA
jgi:hypothetical protein